MTNEQKQQKDLLENELIVMYERLLTISETLEDDDEYDISNAIRHTANCLSLCVKKVQANMFVNDKTQAQ